MTKPPEPWTGAPPCWSPAELVAGLRRADPAAARAFFDACAPRVNALVHRLLGADPDHDDLVQQALLAALGSIRTLADPDRLLAWVAGIAVHIVHRELERRSRRRGVLRRLAEEPPPVATARPGTDLVALRFYALLGELKPEDRIVLALRWVDGEELDAIAAACGCSRATVKRRLARATERFQRRARDDFWLAPLVAAHEEPDPGGDA